MTLEERFWKKVTISGYCWLWKAGKFSEGYGAFSVNGKTVGAHRVSYELEYGPIPEGMEIDHKCHNPPCVRPAHLRAVTHKQNQENRKGAQANSTSGIRGVSFSKARNAWYAHMKHNGKKINLGYFSTKEEAAVAAEDGRTRVFIGNSLQGVAPTK